MEEHHDDNRYSAQTLNVGPETASSLTDCHVPGSPASVTLATTTMVRRLATVMR